MNRFSLTFILLSVSLTAMAQGPSGKKAEPLLYQPRPKGEIVSQAVAQAGTQVVTSREAQISYMMDQALNTPTKKGVVPERKGWQLDPKSDAFQKHLAQILLEIVVQLEAENFSIGQVSPEEISQHEKFLEEQMKGWGPWKELEVAPGEVQKMLLRKLRAKNFLKFKMESSGVQVTDEEAKAFYDKNKAKFGTQPFSQFKDSIKELLSQEQIQEKLKDWFEILKRKYRVRYLGQAE